MPAYGSWQVATAIQTLSRLNVRQRSIVPQGCAISGLMLVCNALQIKPGRAMEPRRFAHHSRVVLPARSMSNAQSLKPVYRMDPVPLHTTSLSFPPQGNGSQCLREAPCGSITTAIHTGRALIRISGHLSESVHFRDPGHWILLGNSGAQLSSPSDAITLEGPNVQVEIRDLSIVDSQNSALVLKDGQVILHHVELARNQGLAIDAIKGEVTLTRSQLHHNLQGGLVVHAGVKFHIASNMLFANGSLTSEHGAIDVMSSEAGSILDFNTLSGNFSGVGASGIECSTRLLFRNNIIVDMTATVGNGPLVEGCQHTTSLSYPTTIPAPPKPLNRVGNPRFVREDDLHIQPDSPAIGGADTTNIDSIAAQDLDGQPRSAPADIGADQHGP